MGENPHQITVTMSFNEKGELEDVKPEGKAEKISLGKPGDPIPVDKIGHPNLRLNVFLYEYGSPGCIIIYTLFGPIRICWPQ
jgi:hypothetical protein